MSDDNHALSPEEIQAKINQEAQKLLEERLEQELSGIKKNRDDLKAEKQQMKDELDRIRAQQESINKFGGLEKVNEILDRISKDEEMKMLADGKFDEVVNRRTERWKADYDSQISHLSNVNQELEQQVKSLKETFNRKNLEEKIREACIKQEVLPHAIEDAILRAERVFKIDEDGKLIARKPDGSVWYGKDPNKSISPSEWLDEQKTPAKHWWKQPQGSGSLGSLGSDSDWQEPNPYSKDSWNLTKQAELKRTNPELAQRLKQRAG